jgi:hypothetical protein
VRLRSGARHIISSSGTRGSAISSSRLFDSSLTRPPSWSQTLALPPANRGRWPCPQADRRLRPFDCWIHGNPQL